MVAKILQLVREQLVLDYSTFIMSLFEKDVSLSRIGLNVISGCNIIDFHSTDALKYFIILLTS